jgi:hypothetical protein
MKLVFVDRRHPMSGLTDFQYHVVVYKHSVPTALKTRHLSSNSSGRYRSRFCNTLECALPGDCYLIFFALISWPSGSRKTM